MRIRTPHITSLIAVGALTLSGCASGEATDTGSQPAEAATDDSAPDDADDPGTDGFTLDTSACPSDVNDPVEAGEPIRFGATLTMTGPAASTGFVSGLTAYFERVNAEGGVEGHTLELVALDDGFDASRAVSNITQLAQQNNVFGLATQQGSGNIVGSQSTVEEFCLPRPVLPAGAPAFADPDTHPWTSMGIMAYDTEARLWVEYITSQYPDGASVGIVAFNSEFGQVYVEELSELLDGTASTIVGTEFHEATAVAVDQQLTALAAARPDVIIGATAGAFCPQVMVAADQAGFDGEFIISALCAGVSSFFVPAGNAADGVLMVANFKDPTDPRFDDDPEVQVYAEDVQSYSDGDPLDSFVAIGYRSAQIIAEALGRAAAMDGGITRANFMMAIWSMDTRMPMGLEGVTFTMDGVTDAYPIESGELVRYDASLGSQVSTGIVLDVEGQTGVYGRD